jgi:hypothetical protein
MVPPIPHYRRFHRRDQATAMHAKTFLPKLTSLLILGACAGLAQAAAAEPARHAITHEDVWLMKRVGAPQPSPDGKWAVFSVTDPAYDSKEQWSDIWIKSLADDSAPRRLTFSKGGESAHASCCSSPSAMATRRRRSTASTSPAAAKRSA